MNEKVFGVNLVVMCVVLKFCNGGMVNYKYNDAGMKWIRSCLKCTRRISYNC